MPEEIFYTVGEDKKIDKLFKHIRKKNIIKDELWEKFQEATTEADKTWTTLRKAICEFKNISLPNNLRHNNIEGTITEATINKED